MSQELPIVYLARHGETEWSLSGQHTGLTDLPLTARGERNATLLGRRLRGLAFARVLTSPLQRASRTCELAGFGAVAELDADLVEWDYGDYEGLRSDEIRRGRPDWDLFRDGCPGGESPQQISARAARVVARLRQQEGDALLFTSGHFTRVLAARWLGWGLENCGSFLVGAGSLNALGYDRSRSSPAICLWNETQYLGS